MAESFLTLMAEYSDADQEKISVWYDAVEKAGFTGSQTKGLKHHISLCMFPLEMEEEAIEITKNTAAAFPKFQVAIRHVGVLPGGNVLAAMPDMCDALTKLQRACDRGKHMGLPFLPHTTMLMADAETLGKALPMLMEKFTPIPATVDRLHLCVFWPTRHIVEVKLKDE